MTGLMRAVAQLGTALNVSVIDVPIPSIVNATDVIVKINATAICGTDLHSYRQPTGSSEQPYLYGHEAIGYITEVGSEVTALSVGDYVVIPDNVDDGHFSYEPDRSGADVFWGGGVLPGLQTEYARVPFADNSLLPLPAVNHTTNFTTLLDYLFISDVLATGWTGVSWSDFQPGDSIAVFGAGPVGLLAAYSAVLRGASRVYLVDQVQARLDLGASIGAIPINFNTSDPVAQIRELEPSGVRRGVEAVGYEAVNSTGQVDSGITMRQLANVTAAQGGIGVLGIHVGSGAMRNFDIGQVYSKGLSLEGGGVLPLQVASQLVPLVVSGRATPSFIVSSVIGIEEAPQYYARYNSLLETKVVIRF